MARQHSIRNSQMSFHSTVAAWKRHTCPGVSGASAESIDASAFSSTARPPRAPAFDRTGKTNAAGLLELLELSHEIPTGVFRLACGSAARGSRSFSALVLGVVGPSLHHAVARRRPAELLGGLDQSSVPLMKGETGPTNARAGLVRPYSLRQEPAIARDVVRGENSTRVAGARGSLRQAFRVDPALATDGRTLCTDARTDATRRRLRGQSIFLSRESHR